jgi:hypothetical protein
MLAQLHTCANHMLLHFVGSIYRLKIIIAHCYDCYLQTTESTRPRCGSSCIYLIYFNMLAQYYDRSLLRLLTITVAYHYDRSRLQLLKITMAHYYDRSLLQLAIRRQLIDRQRNDFYIC